MAKRPKKNEAIHTDLGVAQSNNSTDDTTDDSPNGGVKEARVKLGFPVVGIVASAGGLEAFKSFFSAMPNQCGMAFVLVPHLDAKHKSMMVELISRQTTMPVVEAREGMIIEADTVYIIPPNHCLTMSQGSLRLSDLPEPIGAQTAIDFFLRSLAEDQGELAIGIVLSGTGSHGTLGIREIKRCGGMAMVQSPESAEFDQMPRSAIETGLVDFVLPPVSMPETLLGYTKHPYLNGTETSIASSPNAAEFLKVILELIRAKTKYDFRSYRTNMIMRRIERRMGLVRLDELAKYTELLRSNPIEVEALCKDFLIGVTAFFREPAAFAFLEKNLIPDLVASQRDDIPLRIWVPSCATGEEAYSIAILFLEAFAIAGKPPRMLIFASDINQRSIDVARRGLYPSSIAVDVSADRLRNFFVASDDVHYQVSKQLRDSIVFSTQNVISDAPFSNLDLISCRNLMIYLEPETQQKLISLFHYALIENGHLLLGPAETTWRAASLFAPVSKKWRIYRRVGPASRVTTNVAASKVEIHPRSQLSETPSPSPGKRFKELTDSILRGFTPAAILINQRYEVLYVSGATVDYLEFPTGELTKDLLAMARTGLRTRLRAACHKAISHHITVADKEARVQRNGVYVTCTITVRPLLESNGPDDMVLVLLQDNPIEHCSSAASPNAESVLSTNSDVDGPTLVQLLEYELKSTREELQNTIEEMESANEELQSSNEELESSKEELQSLNEELSTVNCQLLEKVNELDKSNSEITSLMASTEIATLYLDSQLRIKRFTQPTVALFSLLPTDEGRDIRDFASQIDDNQLLEHCQRVLTTKEALETEIFTKDKKCFLRRITPFRTQEHQADGVVVTFVGLTELKKVEAAQRERDACFREIFEHAATGIAITSMQGDFTRCNPAFCKLLGYSQDELRRINFLALVHPEDRSYNLEAFQSLQAGKSSSFEIENRYIHKDGSIVFVRKFVSTLPDGSETTAHIMALVTDISAQRNALDALRQSEERILAILKTASDAIITIDNRGLIDSVNKSTESIFGYSSSEMVGQNVSILMPQPFRREHDSYIQRFLATGEPHIIGKGREVLCRRKDGTTFPADLAVSQVDHLGLFTGILRDISSRKVMQRHILEIASDEQRRIGLELHDGTQQELTGLSLYANALRETIEYATLVDSNTASTWHFKVTEYERLKSIAELLSKRLAETNQHVRDLAHGIMPIQVDAEGLRSALAELAKSINSNEKISCEFECNGEVTIPNNTTATHLYRIAQEAVNNALRHGSAERIRILLALQDDRVVLEVSDNGVGLDNEAVIQGDVLNKGMGMRTMEYRASLIGGRLQILQLHEGGTLVRCEVSKGSNL